MWSFRESSLKIYVQTFWKLPSPSYSSVDALANDMKASNFAFTPINLQVMSNARSSASGLPKTSICSTKESSCASHSGPDTWLNAPERSDVTGHDSHHDARYTILVHYSCIASTALDEFGLCQLVSWTVPQPRCVLCRRMGPKSSASTATHDMS